MAAEEFGTQGQGAETGASQEVRPSATPESQPGQPTRRVNLDDLPEGRALKSTYDQKIAALERRTEQERLARLAAERRADEVAMAGMNETEQLRYQLEKATNYIQEQDIARKQELDQLRKERDIDRLAAESGAPRDAIAAAETYDDAVAAALKFAKQAAQQAAARAAEQEEYEEVTSSGRNSVDLGSGRPPPPVDEWEARRLQIMKDKDPHAYTMHIMGITPGS